uniref:Uncharacterized protein n=1 Tax=Timema monikensis TaxID=170555 RepID=A0A7R9EI19_9NEOP|nr:unnamed protein product [Timema monikensis]
MIRKHDEIPIYNSVGVNSCFLECEKIILERILERPSIHSIWYPWVRTFQSIFLYRLLAIFLHVIPAVLLDGLLWIKGKPPIKGRIKWVPTLPELSPPSSPHPLGPSNPPSRWEPTSDLFSYHVYPSEGTVMKRTALSNTARIFDPVGWLFSVVFWAKAFMQAVWTLRHDWNEPLPPEPGQGLQRVAQIQAAVPAQHWRHVPTNSNMDDCASRNLHPEELTSFHIWFTGPEWLKQPISIWPKLPGVTCQAFESDLEEIKKGQEFSPHVRGLNPFLDQEGLLRRFTAMQRIKFSMLTNPQDIGSQVAFISGRENRSCRRRTIYATSNMIVGIADRSCSPEYFKDWTPSALTLNHSLRDVIFEYLFHGVSIHPDVPYNILALRYGGERTSILKLTKYFRANWRECKDLVEDTRAAEAKGHRCHVPPLQLQTGRVSFLLRFGYGDEPNGPDAMFLLVSCRRAEFPSFYDSVMLMNPKTQMPCSSSSVADR